MNSICSSNSPILSSQNKSFNNLVLKDSQIGKNIFHILKIIIIKVKKIN